MVDNIENLVLYNKENLVSLLQFNASIFLFIIKSKVGTLNRNTVEKGCSGSLCCMILRTCIDVESNNKPLIAHFNKVKYKIIFSLL